MHPINPLQVFHLIYCFIVDTHQYNPSFINNQTPHHLAFSAWLLSSSLFQWMPMFFPSLIHLFLVTKYDYV
ncbi:hypothetical protein P8452_57048 [Trifolium repens]|nr:hypothetical protein P8452_57048 [Trifolium repens]